MDVLEIIGWSGGGAALVMTLLQVSKINLNPWSFLARKLGRAINRDVIEKVDNLQENIERIEQKQSESEAVIARVRILRFGDEMQQNKRHSKEHFDQTMTDIRTYENYCGNHPEFENNVTPATIQYIKEVYMERLRKHDFLQPEKEQEGE